MTYFFLLKLYWCDLIFKCTVAFLRSLHKANSDSGHTVAMKHIKQ